MALAMATGGHAQDVEQGRRKAQACVPCHGPNGNFNALDAKSGKKLWSFNCGAGVNAMPVSYMVGKKQYVAMGCGGNTQLDFKRGNSLFVYALGD